MTPKTMNEQKKKEVLEKRKRTKRIIRIKGGFKK